MKSLFEIYGEHQGKVSDKWSIYLTEYDRLFSGLKAEPIKMLEIGIQNGGSLEIWSKYFPKAQVLVGCDINPDCANLIYDDTRINLVVGDANTDATEKLILAHSPNFDLIIDDGSHASSDIVKSFARYFGHLNYGGLFVIEDLHCSYWQETGGGLYNPYSSMAFFKRLADVINHEHWGVVKERKQLLKGFSEKYSVKFDDGELGSIHSIEFFNSVCVVRKQQSSSNILGKRFITGQSALVTSGVKSYPRTSQTPSQVSNVWAAMMSAPEEAWQELMGKLSDRENYIADISKAFEAHDEQISSLKRVVDERDEQIAGLVEDISALHKSTSWRLTKPLRTLRCLLSQSCITKSLNWLVFQARLMREQGLLSRIKFLIRKLVRISVIRGISYVKARPSLCIRLLYLANKVGLANKFRALYSRMQAAASEVIFPLWRQVVSSYSIWSAYFDSPSEEDARRLILSADFNSPVLVIAQFDQASEMYAKELAVRLVESIGQQWQAVFLFEPNSKIEILVNAIQESTNSDKRIVFNCSEVKMEAQFVVLIQGGAIPRAHALRVFVDELRRRPDALVAYSDEDQFNIGSDPSNPWFKPEFSPLLINQGLLLGRMLVFRNDGVGANSILAKLTNVNTDLEELKCNIAMNAGEAKVIHIPHVLFHDALKSCKLEPLDWSLPKNLPLVTIIIPTRDRWDILGPCLESLKLTDWPSHKLEIIVVDNGSTDLMTLKMLDNAEAASHIRVIRDDLHFNWSRLNNMAVRESHGELLVFLNNDTEVVDSAWLKKLAVHAMRSGVGAVGCKLLYPDRTVQHGGVIAGIQGVAGHAHMLLQANEGGYHNLANITHEVTAVTGACLAVTRENFEMVGGFDESFRMAFNDIVFCFSLHTLGKNNIYVADALFIHYESKSRGYDDTPEKVALQQYEARKAWSLFPQLMHDDPFYSPNLSLWASYELSFAPRRRSSWDEFSARSRKVMMLSITHAVGHGVAVVLALQAEALVRSGFEVIVAGPQSPNDFPYPGCKRVEVHDPLSAATLAAINSVDLVIAHTPPFFSIARWTGAHPPVIAYDYGEPPPEWFPDVEHRRHVLVEKDLALMMASKVFAISDAIESESRTPVHGVIPLGNSHLGKWDGAANTRRQFARAKRGWDDKFVVLNVCRFHKGERQYKGVDFYAEVHNAIQAIDLELSKRTIFVLCGKGSKEDIDEMTRRGLVVEANVTDEEMTELYIAADAYANFSKWEGYNLGIGQALAMGLPSIASDIPAHRAFSIEVTNHIVDAAKLLVQISAQSTERAPRIWSWDDSLSKLVDEVNLICESSI